MSLRDMIQAQLPLSVHDYMQLCLQHPEHGYYRKVAAIGRAGDFITAPEISQIFGDLVGLWLRDIWQQMGEPAFHLVELGPGRGTLSADMVRHLPDCELHLVESNQTLRQQQRETLWQHAPHWHDELSSLPKDRPLLISANEFFDAFPIRQWVEEEERYVSTDWQFEPAGEVTRESCPQAETLMREICQRLKEQGGVFLTFDYGYVSSQPSAASHQQADTLQAIKNHAYHPPLHDPGEADLTAHVDFSVLQKIAKAEQCYTPPITAQESFLRRLGGEIWLQKLLQKTPDPSTQKTLQEGWIRLISPAQMGSLFKVMAVTAQPTLTLNGFDL